MTKVKSGTNGSLKEEQPYYRTKEVITRTDSETGRQKVITHWKDFKSRNIFDNRLDASTYCLGRYLSFVSPDEEEVVRVMAPGDTPELNRQKGDEFTCEVYIRFGGAEGEDVYIQGQDLLMAIVGQSRETEFLKNQHIETLIQGTVNKNNEWHTEVVKSN